MRWRISCLPRGYEWEREEGRGKREEGRGKREEGRGKGKTHVLVH